MPSTPRFIYSSKNACAGCIGIVEYGGVRCDQESPFYRFFDRVNGSIVDAFTAYGLGVHRKNERNKASASASFQQNRGVVSLLV
jgi:hypothetical protein